MKGINSAIIGAAQREKFEIVGMLFEHASADAIERIAPMMLGKEAARAVFEKVLRYMPQLAPKLLDEGIGSCRLRCSAKVTTVYDPR